MSIPILYQDEFLVIVNKPSGLLVHKTNLDKYETRFALQMVRDQIGKIVYPVHRLDKPTSGVLVFALSSAVAKDICLAFAEHQVRKEYLALVRGSLAGSLCIDYPLKEEKAKIRDKHTQKQTPPQSAVTDIESVESIEIPVEIDKYPTSRYSLIKAFPKTGRQHQIRRHLRHIGHPIIGDVTHGSGKHNKYFEETFQKRQLFLASTQISFIHPMTQKTLSVQAPLEEHFQNVLEKLGFSRYGLISMGVIKN